MEYIRVVVKAGRGHPRSEGIDLGEGAVREIGPVATVCVERKGSEEVGAVQVEVDWLEVDEPTGHRSSRWHGAWLPVGKGLANRLAKFVGVA